jgi:hypothetical protein
MSQMGHSRRFGFVRFQRHCGHEFLRQGRDGPRPWENSSAVRARRRISENVRIMKLNHPAQIRLDTVLENCIFYISPMYEFSHSLGQKQKNTLATPSSPAADGPRHRIGLNLEPGFFDTMPSKPLG